MDSKFSFELYNDYAQSANTLFHFMKKAEYLYSILQKRAIIPRYCIEDIAYLNIQNKGHDFKEVAILQKCFCDIPFHKLGENFDLNPVGDAFNSLKDEEKTELKNNNTHFDYYGHFAIGFSKKWGEKNHLQPIQYLNNDSHYTKNFSSLFRNVFEDNDLKSNYVEDIINRLSYIKPLRGSMKRTTSDPKSSLEVNIYKNFHDEREWRYVPDITLTNSLGMENIIANPNAIKHHNEISDNLNDSKYKSIWLGFSYDDIRYIIVPNSFERLNIINTIMKLPDENFISSEDVLQQKYILISKILVLEEIRRDW